VELCGWREDIIEDGSEDRSRSQEIKGFADHSEDLHISRPVLSGSGAMWQRRPPLGFAKAAAAAMATVEALYGAIGLWYSQRAYVRSYTSSRRTYPSGSAA
jgi:hypothetical protein